jgi:hypothetical protein
MLESGQRADPDLGLALVGAAGPHRELVQRRAAVGQEAPEPGGDYRERGRELQLRSAFRPLDPDVGEQVAAERDHDRAGGGHQPPPVDVLHHVPDVVEAGHVGHSGTRAGEQHHGQRNQPKQLEPGAIDMVR